ncbi:MAG: hypothetical protein H6878_13750 [Rhodobiaceae bacterium]|nr:hypothetical protein [Rhodobiaceae bacterium]MCC0017326.1 hypothetical protein [Rhodobiaceae bacterium]MCC0041084.1 hypothetical protein [Rhodobiaceae bacterium]
MDSFDRSGRASADAFDNALDEALAPVPAPAHLRALVMQRIGFEARRDDGLSMLLRPRFSLPALGFAVACLISGYFAGVQYFDATDQFAAELASTMGLTDAGTITEDLL